MCKTPILIPNPNYKLGVVNLSKGQKFFLKDISPGNNSNLYLKDVSSRYIPIPCGKCPDCIHLRQNYFVQRTICETFDNDLFFVTLTYNNESLPYLDINGYKIAYANIKHVQDMLKRIRRNYDLPKFRYMCVSEFGTTNHRPHFHMLLSFPRVSKDIYVKQSFALQLHDIFLKEWSVNIGTNRKPKYKPLCTYKITRKSRNFDLHYVNPSLSNDAESDVAYYVSKYMLKYDNYVDSLKSALFYNIPDYDEFKEVWQKIRPRFLLSKHYGNPTSQKVKNHIRESIDFSLNSGALYPIFINPIKSTSSPLCPYYRKRFLTESDLWDFYFRNPSPFIDSVTESDADYTYNDHEQKIHRLRKNQELLDNRDTILDSDDLDFYNDVISFTSDYVDVPIKYNKLSINDLNYES